MTERSGISGWRTREWRYRLKPADQQTQKKLQAIVNQQEKKSTETPSTLIELLAVPFLYVGQLNLISSAEK